MVNFLKDLGIEKGKPFEPTERQVEAMNEGLVLAYASMQRYFVEPGLATIPLWVDENGDLKKQWLIWDFAEGQAELGFPYETDTEVLIDDRAWGSYFWITYLPKNLGGGTFYLTGLRDADGEMYDHTQTYKLNVPADKYVADIGALGADKGEGGKYLLLHNDDETVVPDGYFELRTKTYEHWLLLRRSPGADGDTTGPVAEIKAGLNVYPLSAADNPPAENFVNISGVQHNTVHANNEDFFEEIHVALDNNPIGAFDPEIVGTFASIGITKGEPFEPDARMKAIYKEAAAIANATARAITYASRDPGVYFYEDRQWNSPFQRQSYLFLEDGARILDDRTYFFYMATGITPAMTAPPVGTGSVYAMTARDKNGAYLDGSKTYKISLPSPVPAKNFASFMLYSGQTRSILETDQQSGGIDSNKPGIKPNEDGSYSIFFGPTAPDGWENNWAQTVPGRSFNVMMRLYGPLEPWFDKSWRPGDLELVE